MNGEHTLAAINNLPTPVVIANQLREGIIDGAFSPGDQVNVALVASQLNVSRGPVREALHRLVQEGLLVARPNRGVFIEDMSLRDMAEVYEAREVIERAASAVIVTFTPEQRQAAASHLLTIVSRMQEPLETNSWSQLGRIDLEFHTELVKSAGNTRLVRAYSTLATEALICLSHFVPDAYPKSDQVIPGHLEIVDLIADGDVDDIHAKLHRHLSLDNYTLHTK